MTKEEFTLRQLKSDRKLYRWLVPIYIGVLVAFLILDVVAFFKKGPSISLGGGLILLSIALRTPSIMQMRDDADIAATEYEAYLNDPDHDESLLSETTYRAINAAPVAVKTLLAQWIAYGVVAFFLYAGFAACVYITFLFEDGNVVLLLVSSLFLVMAIPLSILAIRAYGSWKIAKTLEQ